MLAGTIVLGAYFYLRLSLPTVSGEVQVGNLTAPVEVLRDARFALGFVQMEMNRRIASGRVAEANVRHLASLP